MAEIYQKIQAIIFRKNSNSIEYLALKRTPEKKGTWQPVTGNKEKQDTSLLECVQREIKEETGITTTKNIIEDLYSFSYSGLNSKNGKEFEEHVFGIEVSSNQKITLQKEPYIEHEEYIWSSYDGVFELFEYTQQREALNKIHQMLIKELN